ncbi:MAG TPA: Crp/Fnr family transcriptional regulator [Cyanobacteria bacterium UBA8803]|nr:Crp/Fnr family transcriptional regulator [Cyanobacteria bacterium UBA9273]HBL60222.1 Crp/Fnr family transcriptional regulator [Cyanobacteria bacterium UBA8803]
MTAFPSSPNQYTDSTQKIFARRSFLPLKNDSLWLIKTGVVRTITFEEDGTSRTLGLWGNGDIVGKALSLSCSYQIECLTRVTTTLLPQHSWHQATEAMMRHIQHYGKLIEILQTRQGESSLFQLLVWLSNRFGQPVEQGQLIDLGLTHQDIADIIGLTRVTVTRMLNTLEKQGIIERLPGKSIVLHEQNPFWYYEI